jgi:hypothetical protein
MQNTYEPEKRALTRHYKDRPRIGVRENAHLAVGIRLRQAGFPMRSMLKSDNCLEHVELGALQERGSI